MGLHAQRACFPNVAHDITALFFSRYSPCILCTKASKLKGMNTGVFYNFY